MSWIRLAVAGLALSAGASVAGAQGSPPAGGPDHSQHQGSMRAHGMHAKMFEGITLTAEQKTKIDALHAQHKAHRAQMSPGGKQGSAPAGNAARAKRKEAMEKQHAAIRAVLTAEQRIVFDRNLLEMKQRRGKVRGAART